MINILVCDDDMEFAVLENGVIENAAKRYEQEVWTDFYKSGKELIASLEQQEDRKLCIVLLDIDMPEMNGYDVAKIINERFSEVLIVFVSNREDLVFQAFEYKPFRFVRKNHMEVDLRHALRKAFEVMERRMDKETVVVCKGEKILLAHSEITYLLMRSRKVNFFLKDGKVLEVRGSMKGMLEELADKKLIPINSGCAVNADYVASYTSDTVVLKSGEKLPISRDKAKEVKIQIERNWRK